MKYDMQYIFQPTELQHLLNESRKSPGMSISEDEGKATKSPLIELKVQMTDAKLKTCQRLIVAGAVISEDEKPLLGIWKKQAKPDA
jgi:hypothetical protein